MRLIVPLMLSFAVVSAQAAENKQKESSFPTEEDFKMISRCSHAAHLAIAVADIHPDSQEFRMNLITEVYKGLEESQRLGEATPTRFEVLTAQATIETFLEKGIRSSTPQLHDWLVGQAAATCAIQTKSSQ